LTDVVKGCDAGIFRLPSTVAMRVAKKFMKTGLPYATEIVFYAMDGADSANGFLEKLFWKIIHKDMQYVCGSANGVSCVTSHFLQQFYYSKRTDAFTANYSSLSLDKTFYTSPRKYPEGKVMTIAHTANNINFNGRKGHKELIEALKHLKDKGVVVKLKCAGEDWSNGTVLLTDYAKSLGVAEQVDFVGFLNRQELSEMLDRADLFVLPTRAEGLPRVIIEAMAKGLPCVSTRVSGNHELLDANYLVDYDDVEALADRIDLLVKNRSEYETVSKTNYENSLQYEDELLQVRRDEFYTKLKNCIINNT
jgi:glycosyltransferase involved in cell wall biosynthesis